MRIQHNIMAMNAYRNYTTNASALQKNLERLSSGFKINRAGDDAAGLAISEKMRAQITGLQVAQKNAKDGISLVQTAEGALTEVHDMLNRMVELATQSANGTYSNDTDRVQLQKEMDQLRDEIDRIADSANFNGIQLLDGNMDAGGDVVYTKGAFLFSELHPAGTGSFPLLPDVVDGATAVRGVDTILHTDGTRGGDTNAFSIDLHNLELKAGKSIDIAIGENITITVSNSGNDAVSADEIVAAIANGGVSKDGKITADFGDATFGKNADNEDVLTIGKTEFKLSASGSRLTFTQVSDDDGLKMPQKVEISDTTNPLEVEGADAAKIDYASGASDTLTINLGGLSVDKPGTVTIRLLGQKYDIDISQDDIDAAATTPLDELIASRLATAMGTSITDADGNTLTVGAASGATITLTGASGVSLEEADTTIKVTGKESDGSVSGSVTATVTDASGGAVANWQRYLDLTSATASSSNLSKTNVPDGVVVKVEIGDAKFEVRLFYNDSTDALKTSGKEGVDWVSYGVNMPSGTGSSTLTGADIAEKIKGALEAQIEAYNAEQKKTGGNTIELGEDGIVFDHTGGNNTGATNTITVNYTDTPPAAAGGQNFSGDYNPATTVLETKYEGTQDRLASTVFKLTKDMVSEGSTITIGRDTYTFTTDKSKTGKDGYVVYNADDSLNTIAEKLTEAAKNNSTYTVGHNTAEGEITITEKEDQTNFDLTTMEGIEKSLGFKIATTRSTDTSKGLTLQIGDTAQSYNQLKVNIKDCHAKALGLDQISIANQTDAGEAVDLVNEAINYISDVRGTLGATQNRLDHTINNLSVMTENIQDAESTIRDTDIAEEMMSYTKNNILIQAAQAMLAQANMVPQGVLQLLQ